MKKPSEGEIITEAMSRKMGSGLYSQEFVEGAKWAISQMEQDDQSRWISCEERFPGDEEDVLVCDIEGDVFPDNYKDGFGWLCRCIVTHWQPLPSIPQPPKQ